MKHASYNKVTFDNTKSSSMPTSVLQVDSTASWTVGLCPSFRILMNTAMTLASHRESQHDLTDSSWVSVWRENLLIKPMHWGSWIWFVDSICYIYFHFLLYLHFRSVHISSKSLLYMFPLTNPDLIYVYRCSYINSGCPVTEISSF
jgi:hypothetical protein